MKIAKDGEILLTDALKAMELKDETNNPVKFSLRFFLYSQEKINKNGEIREHKDVTLGGLPYNVKDNMQRGIVLPNGERKSFNIFLLDRFNDKKVIQ